jgi:hypothetical protein
MVSLLFIFEEFGSPKSSKSFYGGKTPTRRRRRILGENRLNREELAANPGMRGAEEGQGPECRLQSCVRASAGQCG